MKRTGIIFLFLITLSFNNRAQVTEILRPEVYLDTTAFGIEIKQVKGFPRMALVLSGGGARSISQLGVIKALEENNIDIDIIAGTSMGSVVGGLYSAGYSVAQLDSIILNAPWDDFFSFGKTDRRELFIDQKITEDKAIFALRLDGFTPVVPTSFNTGQKIANFLTLLTLNAPVHVKENFNDLLYKYRAVSTDLVSGKTVVLDRGPLSLAMRSSSSVSFLLAPVKVGDLLLVDGGLVANIPVSVARSLNADYIFAVNSTSPLYNYDELKFPWNIADQLVSIPMQILNTSQLDNADLVIEPELGDNSNSDFAMIKDFIDAGYNSTINVVDSLKESVSAFFSDKQSSVKKFYKNPRFSGIDKEMIDIYFGRFSGMDSVSNHDILCAAGKMIEGGGLQNAEAKITEAGDSTWIEIIPEKNTVVSKIKISGITLIDSQFVEKSFSAILNKPYNGKKLLEAVLRVINQYRKGGYSLATLEYFYFFPASGVLDLTFDEGKISKITIKGDLRTEKGIITREFPLAEGEYFDYFKAEKGLTNLRSTNLFEQIEMEIAGTNGQTEIILKLQEKISSLIRFGLRIDNENFAQVLLDVRDENLLGTGTEIGAQFSYGERTRSYLAEHKANRIFDSYFTYKIKAFYNFIDVYSYKNKPNTPDNRFSRKRDGEYRQIHYGASVGVGTQVEKFGNLLIEGKIQKDEIANKKDYTGETYKQNITSLRLSLNVDSQDRYPFPKGGFLIKSYYETAQPFFISDISYAKFFLDYKSFFSISQQSTFSARFVLGIADETLPLSQHFSLGGQNQFFGLHEHDYRGRQIMTSSAEYRLDLPFKIFFDAYLKFRYDLGSVWINKEEIRFKDLRHGIGTTISLDTPVGPADLSVGRSFIFKNISAKNTLVWGDVLFYFSIGYYY